MKRKFIYLSLCIILLLIAAWATPVAFAGRLEPGPDPQRPFPDTGTDRSVTDSELPEVPPTPLITSSTPAPTDIPTLLEKFKTQEQVRIIVGLDTAFVPEGSLPDQAAVARQQAQITQMQDAVLASLSGKTAVNARYQFIPFMALTVDETAFNELLKSPQIASIQEDRLSAPLLDSSVPAIGGDQAHANGLTGAGSVVAILDSGVQWDHEFLGGPASSRVVGEACFSSTNPFLGATSICAPAPHVANSNTAACQSGATNLCAHGTHVAGIAAGSQQTASVSYDGVAPEAGIFAVQVFTRFPAYYCSLFGYSTACVLSYDSDQILGLQEIYNQRNNFNITAVNMSLGGSLFNDEAACDAAAPATKAAIDSLRSVGIVTIIAAGNDGDKGQISAPGCISTAVAVGVTDDSDVVPAYANSSSLIELLAPGVSIDSSVPLDNGQLYATYQGSSMSTAHVTGAWALMKQLNPTASVDEILATLQDTGVTVMDTNGLGLPRIQVDAALAALAPNVWQGANSADWQDGGNWSAGAVPTCAEQAIIPASASRFPAITADAAAMNLVLEDGAFLSMADHTLTLCGNLEVNGTAVFSATGGTILFDGPTDAAITLPANHPPLHHLQIGNGVESKKVSLQNDLQLAGSLTIHEMAALKANGHTLTFTGSGQNLNVLGTAVVDTIYSNDFSSISGWTIADANGDRNPWYASTSTNAPNNPNSGQHGRYFSNAAAANDWLFSPGFALEAGHTYTVTFDYGARRTGSPERLGVYAGSANSVAAMTTQLFNNDSVTNTSWAHGSGVFSPAADGAYYIGFHAYSNANMRELAVDNLVVQTERTAVFHNLVVAPGASLTLTSAIPVVFTNDVTVQGELNLGATEIFVNGRIANFGALRETKPVAADTNFLFITDAAGTAVKYRGVEISSPAGDMGSTTVEIRGNQTCTTNPADAIFHRCFNIAPTTPQNAAIRVWLTEAERNGQDASAAQLWHWNGSSWEGISSVHTYDQSANSVTCDSVDGDHCWVEAATVRNYSPFVVGTGLSAPTAVSLQSMHVASSQTAVPIILLPLALFLLASFWPLRRRHR